MPDEQNEGRGHPVRQLVIKDRQAGSPGRIG
jgi:hypothetical protein